jgi:ribosomal protein S18 acetylase RimI-like enzyme
MDLQPLRPSDRAHAAVVAGWARSADEVVMWCGRPEFPLPAEMVQAWPEDPEVRAHLLVADDVPIGYGELWLDAEENEVELARIILAPAARGRGLGQALVLALLRRAVATGYGDIFMRVHPDNKAALRCYRHAGFVPVAPELAAEWNVPQPLDYVWLQPSDPASAG